MVAQEGEELVAAQLPQVPGVTRFAVGEEAVVFAYRAPNGYLRVRGLDQGKYEVAADSRTR